MKVLVCAPDQISTREGGLSTQVYRTVTEMKKLGHMVDFFDGVTKKDYYKYDICHVFSMNLPTHYKALAIKSLGIPIVYSSVMWRRGNKRAIRLATNVFKLFGGKIQNDLSSCYEQSQWATRILPNTYAEADWLQECLGVDRHKCYVVPNAADDVFENVRAERDPKKLVKDTRVIDLVNKYDNNYVLSVCVISDRKNLLKLSRSCNKANIKLVIVGPTTDINIYNLLVEMKSSGFDIELLGGFDAGSSEIGYLIKHCKLFALVSEYETPGIAALEAAFFDKNILITKVGGTAEYFEEYAVYVNPSSQIDITSKLKQALIKKENIGVGDHVRKNFTWKIVAEKTIENYISAIEK